MERREFVKSAGLLAASATTDLKSFGFMPALVKPIRITAVSSNFEREPLTRPIGFKGGFLTELWQTAACIRSSSGLSKVGVATQSVLYGDPDIFSSYSEAGGNALMFSLTDSVLQLLKNTTFTDPVTLADQILPEVLEIAKKLTRKTTVNPNFIYNALVSIDNAIWLLYAAENQFNTFDAMMPDAYKKALSHHNDKIAVMFQIPYGMPVNEITRAAEQGYFVMKIKSGSPGNQDQMLRADMERLTQIHNTLKNSRTNQTQDGKLIYTIDANARYEKKDTLQRYLDHAKKIGAFSQIQLFEEPLQEHNNENVSDTGIRIGADESVHNEADARRRLELGYTALVLKGIAKTLSQSVKIAKLAFERNVPCICADLTVNPILIDWNKNLAARLLPFPGIGMGVMETNGDMNYSNWKNMLGYHPNAGAAWTQVKNGIFQLTPDYYKQSGGILAPSAHYQQLANQATN